MGTQILGDGAEALNGEGRKTFLNLKVFELINNFMPSPGVNARILKARITIPSTLTINVINVTSHVTNNNARGSMDAVPGGTFGTNYIIYKQFSTALKEQKVRQTWSTISTEHSFIPTISALGFKNSSFNWNNRVDDRNLVCNNEIYFDNYYAPTSNQDHVYLNTDNVNWLIREIDNIPGCMAICADLSIAGDDALCTTTSNNYFINNLPAGATVLWETSPTGVATPNTPTSSQTTLTKNGDGIITLKASITNACNIAVPLTKVLTVGFPFSPSNTFVSAESGIIFVSHPPEFIVNAYRWYRDGVFFKETAAPQLKTITDQCHYWSVSFVTPCGESPETYPISVGCEEEMMMSLSPNPSSDKTKVSLFEKGKPEKKKKILQLKIIDKTGIIRRQYDYGTGVQDPTISVRGLLPDVYTVLAFNGSKWITTKLLVQ